MTEINILNLKNNHQLREFEEKRSQERKRNLLHLILHYLNETGYQESASLLLNEAQLSTNYEVCDNIDLTTILQDYESYYYARFQKYPKFCKKVAPGDVPQNKTTVKPIRKLDTKPRLKREQDKLPIDDFGIQVTSFLPIQQDDQWKSKKVLKSLKNFKHQNVEWLELAEMISKEICMEQLDIHWHDIMGLDEAKKLLKESVVYPLKYPTLFTGVLAPWKGLLMFGPPGTGKTLLAKAVATESKTTFFNISASTIVSKWRGDSEKLVRVLFDLARYHAPSTIFLDELDALAYRRDGMEHEASRRLQTELLIQMDGLANTAEQVFVLATSNLPWELDPAMLRRLEKRILVDLPNSAAREKMLQYYLPPKLNTQPIITCDIYYSFLSEELKGYSGSDIKLVCKEAAIAAVRGVFENLEDPKNTQASMTIRPITTSDVQTALKKTQPSASHLREKYKLWTEQFGSQ